MSENSSYQPTLSNQNPKFLGLGSDPVSNLEPDRSRGPLCLDLGESMVEGQDSDRTSNCRNRSGIKRVGEEIGVDLGVKSAGISDSLCGKIGENLRAKKVRVSDTIHVEFRDANEGIESPIVDKDDVGVKGSKELGGSEEVSIDIEVKEAEEVEDRAMGLEELGFGIEEEEEEEHRVLKGIEGCGNGDGDGDREEDVNEKSVHVKSDNGSFGCGHSTQMSEEANCDFDLNVPVLEADYGGSEIGLQEYTQVGPVIAETKVEIIDISSDENEDEDEGVKLVGARGNEKDIESGGGFDLDWGTMKTDQAACGTSSMSGRRRYTREEKGKAKLVESWLSLATNTMQLDLSPEMQESIESAVSGCILLPETSQPGETTQLHETERLAFREDPTIYSAPVTQDRQRENADRYRQIVSRHAHRLARFNSEREDYYQESIDQEQKMPSMEADMVLEDLLSPFSTALKILKDRNSKQNPQQLIKWNPSEDHDHNLSTPLVPSLLDLSLKVLADNAEAIVSLEPVPDALKRRLTDLLCDSRKMNIRALDLLVRGSLTEIRMKDCSWITEEQFTATFSTFDAKNLKVLQLDLCGQCVLDDVIGKTLARSSNSLPGLGILSLRGACRLSDTALKALVLSAPSLHSINLGQCSLLTSDGINTLADSLGSILRELYIDDCQQIDAMLIIAPLKKFEHLEVLSVAGIQTICDEFVSGIIPLHGQKIKELDLADCWKLTDVSLKVIGKTCSDLCSLNISNVHKLTDMGIQCLANGCRSVQALKLCRNGFSDEAIAAFLEVSGSSLKELSLNHVSKVGPSTALSLAKCSRKLLSLDLSWCRRITNEALGLIVDSCLSLKLLKLFGCTQITNVFLNGHSNSLVRIIGLNLTSTLEHVNMLEAEEVFLRYSALPFSSDSQSMGQEDVRCI